MDVDRKYDENTIALPQASNFTTDEMDIEYGGGYNEGVNSDGYRSIRARQDNGEFPGSERDNNHVVKKSYAISARFGRVDDRVNLNKEDRRALFKEQTDSERLIVIVDEIGGVRLF